jgi:hypothetical protein
VRLFVCVKERWGDLEKGVRDLFEGILLVSLPYLYTRHEEHEKALNKAVVRLKLEPVTF